MTFEFHSKIAGTTFSNCQKQLQSLHQGEELELVRETENVYDPNAIAIYKEGELNRLGYLPKDTAAKINEDVKEGRVLCTVSEITGGVEGKENIGCNIKLAINRPELDDAN